MAKTYKKPNFTFNDTFEDEEEILPLLIKTESDILYYYNNVETQLDMDMVYDAILDFDIEDKIEKFKNVLYQIYKDAFEEFMNIETPTHIFDTGLYNNQLTNFIDCIYTSSNKGKELELVLQIYYKYLENVVTVKK